MRPPTTARRGFLAVALAAFATLGLTAGTADASWVFKFEKKVTTNTAVTGEKFVLEIFDADTATGKVNFKIWNTGLAGSSITEFYVQDGLLVEANPTNFQYSSGSDASFSGGTPGGKNLSGGNSLNPKFTATSALNTVSTGHDDGVEKGEWAQFTYQAKTKTGGGYYTAADLAALANSTYLWTVNNPGVKLPDPHLRFGIHVQGLPGSGSDSFINTGGDEDPDGFDPLGDPVPAPPAVVLAVMGVGLFGFVGRRLRRPATA